MTSGADFFARLDNLIKDASDDPSKSTAEILKDWGLPSTSIAVLDNGNITSHCISSAGNDSDTLFQTCSISKPAAVMAVMRLIEEGVLALDDKICDRLPEHITRHLLKDPTTAPLVRTITLKQLLSHTSGLSQGGFPGYSDKENVPSPSDVITGGPLVNTMPVQLISIPGLELMYSGGGCVLYQLIMEHATQKTFDQIMTEYVLEPLNMTRSCYKLSPHEKNLSRCYWNGTVPTDADWHVIPEQAAAGLWTTPTDLLKLIRAMQQSLNTDEASSSPSFMKQSTAQTMLTRIKQHIALGWFTSASQFGHSGGNYPSYQCFAYGYASQPWNKNDSPLQANNKDKLDAPKNLIETIPEGCGVAIMCNSSVAGRVYSLLLHAITYLKGWPSHHEYNGVVGISPPARAPSGTPTNPAWKGWLGHNWSDTWELVEDNNNEGQPALKFAGLGDGGIVHPLKPAALTSRKYEGGRESVEFVVDGLRLAIRLDWDGDERVVEFWNGGKESRVVLRETKEGQGGG